MKKYLITLCLLIGIMSSWGCSSDEETPQNIYQQYIYQNDTLTMAVKFVDNGSAFVHVFIENNIEYQDIYTAGFTGAYPNYTLYSHGEKEPLTMTCSFSSTDEFTANVVINGIDGVYWLYRFRYITLPRVMHFKKDNRVLDANGDGILDWTQDWY